jgi:release factor glutamine methyltransferase
MVKAIEKLKEIALFLKSKGIKDSTKEAEILILKALSISKSDLYTKSFDIAEDIEKKIDEFVERRAKGEPIQYIIGHVEFFDLKIYVGKGVLIPRPETELLVEEAIKLLREFTPYGSGFTILDLCTGSGCIALALAKNFPEAIIYGIDSSEIAINYAIRNAEENNIKNVNFLKGDLFEPVKDRRFDCIISNPPYIKRKDLKKLQREIREYEPAQALDGGEDGLHYHRRILKEASNHLKEKGIIILEIGFNQADDVLLIANKAGFSKVNFIKDYSGIERICIIRYEC